MPDDYRIATSRSNFNGHVFTDKHANGIAFNAAAWIGRLAAALEDVAAQARPAFPFSPETPHYGPLEEYWPSIHRQYRELAARAKHDPTAAQLFAESPLWLKSDPVEARAILREHPLLRPGLIGSGKCEGVGFILPTHDWFHVDLKSLVSHLAKRAMKDSGEQAAQLLHRYLTAGEEANLPAYEITLLHGLKLDRRFDLGSEAYLAPYEDAKATYGLPDEPAKWLDGAGRNPSHSIRPGSTTALVRSLRWGPGVAPPPDSDDFSTSRACALKVKYRFPGDYELDLTDRLPDDNKVLVDLLSIATRSPLISHTSFVRVAKWIEEIDPNFACSLRNSSAYLSDAAPKEHPFSQQDATAFASLASRWCTYRGRRDVIDLAIRRLAASLARSGGPFSAEDRILDVSIALEIMYGPIKHKLTHQLATRAKRLLGQGTDQRGWISARVKSFYEVRSAIVHGQKKIKGGQRAIDKALEDGRDLACLTLAELLSRGPIRDWDKPMGDT
ncbi:MAG: hypothetical protein F4Y91_22740 [Gemmatimonadetes bacterium]|nr:hypothetical protein [Gemmatimonadota bacterium]MXY84793.1 hypothetical protein [Gemmatimonadota bacterium]MYB68973.1 hypothetical protein [Gemmatimonadota bacterium]